MANSKQKPVPEGVKRSPGKSKFSIPRKEAPPIDGSYLDRLFADYDKQTQELQGQGDAAPTPLIHSAEPAAVVEQPRMEDEEAAAILMPAASIAEISEQTPPAGPVPFPRNESIVSQEVEPVASARPEAIPTASTHQTVARSPQRRPAALVPSVAPDSDAELLDKWKRKHRLGKGEVKVLRAMLGMCREEGGNACYIKIPQLMQAAELRERQTQLVIRSLRELGLIEKVADYSNLDRLGTRYRVVLDAD
ncbi:MAG: hypothetical protein QOH49_4961 [Acidobacteriota bacterium]|nr:hypothetical protein [Acidobacteriota bacterium]